MNSPLSSRAAVKRLCLLVLSLWLTGSALAETTAYSGAALVDHYSFSIGTPGTYYLAQDFTVSMQSGVFFDVECSNVTIDLNGHTITNTYGPATGAYGLLAQNRANVTVRNGTIGGFFYGIFVLPYSPTTSYGHLVENVTFLQNTFCAANLQGVGCRFHRCRAVFTGGTTLNNATYNFALDGTGNSAEDCDVSGKTGANPAIGISNAQATDNFFINNRISGVDYGIAILTGGFTYRDNLTSGVAYPYVGGTDAGNNH